MTTDRVDSLAARATQGADLERIAVTFDGQSIRDTLSLIDATRIGAVLFLDEGRRILGFVSDGDVRRALIDGAELSDRIDRIWTATPLALPERSGIAERYAALKARNLRQLLLVDEDGVFAGLQTRQQIEDLYEVNPKRCPVLLMAGGRGQRLMPLTADCPKPMLKVGETPLLEQIILRLAEQGFETFYLSVNYLRRKIMDHFGDGRRLGVQIHYVEEDEPTGTGGCLRLLPELSGRHLLIMNGDVITDLDLRSLLSFHDAQRFAATMVVREQESRIEYGVVRVDGPRFVRLDEKPRQSYFVNAGVYALDIGALDALPDGQAFGMPDVFQALRERGRPCGVFEHVGTWIDIGDVKQLEAARRSAGG